MEYVQGISVVKSFNMCDKNLSDIEDAYESNAAASYGVERVFTPLNMTYSMVFRISACMIMLCAESSLLAATCLSLISPLF